MRNRGRPSRSLAPKRVRGSGFWARGICPEPAAQSLSTMQHQSDNLRIGERSFRSRLIVGTGKYATFTLMREAIEASGAEIVTVAVRRINLDVNS